MVVYNSIHIRWGAHAWRHETWRIGLVVEPIWTLRAASTTSWRSTMVFKSRVTFGILGTLTLLGVSAHAAADQLADIKARGTLTCAVLGNFEPYGFSSADRQIVGYDVDTCKSIAKHLGVKAEIKPVTNEARIPELQAGR